MEEHNAIIQNFNYMRAPLPKFADDRGNCDDRIHSAENGTFVLIDPNSSIAPC